jgi:hypothetical protein
MSDWCKTKSGQPVVDPFVDAAGRQFLECKAMRELRRLRERLGDEKKVCGMLRKMQYDIERIGCAMKSLVERLTSDEE